MDTNVQALKELYVSLGGKASDVENLTTSSEVITAMKSVAASMESELSKISSSEADSCIGSFSGEDYTVTFTNITHEGARINHKNNIEYYVTFTDGGTACRLTPYFSKTVGSHGSLPFRGFMVYSNDDVYMIILTVSTSDEVTVRRIKLGSATIPEP